MARDLLRLRVRCDELAPQVVRTAMSEVPAIDGRRDDACLIASELVTNAVVHSLCGSEDFLDVCIRWDGWLRISVLDPGTSGGMAEIVERPAGLGGLGLKVVQRAADRWGSDRRPEGYEVWAEMQLTE